MSTRAKQLFGEVVQRGMAVIVAALLTLALFLVLPVMSAIGDPIKDIDIRSVDAVMNAPPPPMEEQEMEEPEEEPPPPPPKLESEAPPLDLSQLELALNPSVGDGLTGDFAINVADALGGGEDGGVDEIFSLADLDQTPRVVFQRQPRYPAEMLKARRTGTVYVLFFVDKTGRVVNPRIQKSTDPGFEAAALEAVKQWKFEPGTRNGEKVSFKMRIPIAFDSNS